MQVARSDVSPVTSSSVSKVSTNAARISKVFFNPKKVDFRQRKPIPKGTILPSRHKLRGEARDRARKNQPPIHEETSSREEVMIMDISPPSRAPLPQPAEVPPQDTTYEVNEEFDGARQDFEQSPALLQQLYSQFNEEEPEQPYEEYDQDGWPIEEPSAFGSRVQEHFEKNYQEEPAQDFGWQAPEHTSQQQYGDPPVQSSGPTTDAEDEYRAKQNALHELGRLAMLGFHPTRPYSYADNLQDMLFEIDQLNMNRESVGMIKHLKNMAKMPAIAAYYGNHYLGPFLDLDGFVPTWTQTVEDHNAAIESIYRKYFKRSNSNPITTLLMAFVGALIITHCKNKFGNIFGNAASSDAKEEKKSATTVHDLHHSPATATHMPPYYSYQPNMGYGYFAQQPYYPPTYPQQSYSYAQPYASQQYPPQQTYWPPAPQQQYTQSYSPQGFPAMHSQPTAEYSQPAGQGYAHAPYQSSMPFAYGKETYPSTAEQHVTSFAESQTADPYGNTASYPVAAQEEPPMQSEAPVDMTRRKKVPPLQKS